MTRTSKACLHLVRPGGGREGRRAGMGGAFRAEVRPPSRHRCATTSTDLSTKVRAGAVRAGQQGGSETRVPKVAVTAIGARTNLERLSAEKIECVLTCGGGPPLLSLYSCRQCALRLEVALAERSQPRPVYIRRGT